MPLVTDAIDFIKQRLASSCQRLLEIREEKKKLAAGYNRYVAIHSEQQSLERTVDRLAGILGAEGLRAAMEEDESDAIGNTIEPFATPRGVRDQLALWEAMEEYLGFRGEARIAEMQGFLQSLRLKQSREAIESALRRHSSIFRVRKSGREKFISLRRKTG